MQSRGVALAFLTAIISGFAVYVNAYGVREFPSPAVYATVRNSLVGLALLTLLLLRTQARQEARRVTLRQGLSLALLGIIGGSIPFVLFFEGLSRVSSGDAALIHKTLFLWVAILAVLFLRERLGAGQVAALVLLLVAQVLSGSPEALRPGTGEAMILLATLLWSVEAVLAKRVLMTLSSSLGATARMGFGGGVLLIYLAVTGKLGVLGELTATQWAWAIGPSLLLLAYVATWYAALKRARATTVTCALTVGAPITVALSTLSGRALPRPEEIAGYGVLIVAVLLYTALSRRQLVPRQSSPTTVGRSA